MSWRLIILVVKRVGGVVIVVVVGNISEANTTSRKTCRRGSDSVIGGNISKANTTSCKSYVHIPLVPAIPRTLQLSVSPGYTYSRCPPGSFSCLQ
jgi:hypothetical protein